MTTEQTKRRARNDAKRVLAVRFYSLTIKI